MTYRRWWIGALLVFAVAAGGALFWPEAEPRVAPPATAVEAAASSAPVPGPAREATLARRIYAVTLTQQVELDGEPLVAARLTGKLEWLALPDEGLVELRLAQTSLTGTGDDGPTKAELEREVLLRLDDGGRLEGLQFARNTGEAARLLLTALASSLQLTPGDGLTWSVTESDGTGAYRATYARTGARQIVRRKSGYTRLHDGEGPMQVEGTATFSLGADGGFAKAEATETSRMRSPSIGEVVGELAVTVGLVDRVVVSDEEKLAALDRAARYAPAAMVFAEEELPVDRLIDEQRARGKTLAGLRQAFAETEGLPRTGETGRLRADLIGTAGALFRTQPREAIAAGEALGAAGVSDAEANFLAGGLAAADTRESAHALASALTSRDATPEAQRQAAASLALSSTADATTVDALSEAARSDDSSVSSMAKLALGAQARSLDDDAGHDPVAELLVEYERASDFSTRAMLLAALGNSGDVRALTPIAGALALPPLAPTAAYALRFIASPEADRLLELALQSSAPAVRHAAYRAAAHRLPAWAARLAAALEHESDPRCIEVIRAALGRAGA